MPSSSSNSSSAADAGDLDDQVVQIPEEGGSCAGAGAITPSDVRLPPEGRFVPVPRSIHEYALKMECPVYQVNAQRFFGPPISVAKNWTPEKGSEVFIGRLPRDVLEPELIPWLEQIGPVFQVRMMMDFSGTNKGFCFVKYFTKEQANLAIEALNQKDLNGSKVVVAKSLDNKRLIISGVSTDKTEDDVREVVETMSDGVTDVEINWQVDIGKPVNQRGVAYVTYESHRDAAIARKQMLQRPMFMWNQRVFADWAESSEDGRPYRNRKLGGNGQHVLVVHGLAKETRLQTMWATFRSLGPFCGVDYIQMTKKKEKCFVFFRTKAQAEVAKGAFDGEEILGCRVRVGWCDPETAPKRKPLAKRKPRANFPKTVAALASPLASSSQQPCLDPAHVWTGMQQPYQYHQQMWYPQQEMVPQMMMMPVPMPTCGPVSCVSSGPSQEWQSQAAGVGFGHGQVLYQAFQFQCPGQEGPSGTVYYCPVSLPCCQPGCQQHVQGYQEVSSAWGEGEAGAVGYPSSSVPSAAYPPVYWSNYTSIDYYQQGAAGGEPEGESEVNAQENPPGEDKQGEDKQGEDQQGEDKQGEDQQGEDKQGEDKQGEEKNDQQAGEQNAISDLYNSSIWM